jgi:chromosome segregation ATPase
MSPSEELQLEMTRSPVVRAEIESLNKRCQTAGETLQELLAAAALGDKEKDTRIHSLILEVEQLEKAINDKNNCMNAVCDELQASINKLDVTLKSERAEIKTLKNELSDRIEKLVWSNNEVRNLSAGLDTMRAEVNKLTNLVKMRDSTIVELKVKLSEALRKSRPPMEALFNSSELSNARVLPIFWRANDYKTFEEACADHATYSGEFVMGFNALSDVMENAATACDCFSFSSGGQLRARISLGGHDYDIDRKAKEV